MKKALLLLIVVTLSGCVFVSHERSHPRRGDYYYGIQDMPTSMNLALAHGRVQTRHG